jgi:hypothetical protein
MVADHIAGLDSGNAPDFWRIAQQALAGKPRRALERCASRAWSAQTGGAPTRMHRTWLVCGCTGVPLGGRGEAQPGPAPTPISLFCLRKNFFYFFTTTRL